MSSIQAALCSGTEQAIAPVLHLLKKFRQLWQRCFVAHYHIFALVVNISMHLIIVTVAMMGGAFGFLQQAYLLFSDVLIL